jgi:hypothetical protein
MILGKILGDTRPATIYQYDRFRATWRWVAADAPAAADFAYRFNAPSTNAPRAVALTIGLSAIIDPVLVCEAMASIPHQSVLFFTASPGYSIIRQAGDLEQFQIAMRACLNEIEARYGSRCDIHVFPAMPASTAIQFGRLLLPKSSPGVLVYDHQRGADGFTPTTWLCSQRAELPIAQGDM